MNTDSPRPEHGAHPVAAAGELRSFPSLEKRFWLLTLLSSIGAYVCLVIAVDLIAKSDAIMIAEGVLVGAIGAATTAIVAGGARLAYVPRAFLKVFLRTDSLTFDRDGRIFEIPFSQVASVSLRSWPAFAARLRLHLADGRTINLSFAIAGVERAAEAILAAQPKMMAPDRASAFTDRLKFAANRAARAYELPGNWLAFFLGKYVVFPIGFGILALNFIKCLIQKDFYLWHVMRYNPMHYLVYPCLIVVALAALAGIGFNLARELLVSAHERRGNARDTEFERETRLWFTGAYFCCGFLFYSAFFYMITSP